MIDPEIRPATLHWTDVLRRFLKLFVPLAAVLLALGGMDAWREWRARGAMLEVSLRDAWTAQRHVASAELDHAIRDVSFLAAHPDVAALAQDPGSSRRADHVAAMFRSFCEGKALYFQARMLDADGAERVRVAYAGGRAQPAGPPRDRSERDVFGRVMALEPGQIYVSPMTLNAVDGVVAQPPTPTLHFGAVVAGPNGEELGAVVIDYRAEALLNALAAPYAALPGELMLLNESGYWLMAPDPAGAGGFMYEDKRGRGFEAANPRAWARIEAGGSGQFRDGGALWTFVTFNPLAEAGLPELVCCPSTGKPMSDADAHGLIWRSVSRVPPSYLAAQWREALLRRVHIVAVVLALLAGLCWLWARTSCLRTQAAGIIAEQNRFLHTILDALEHPFYVVDVRSFSVVLANEAARTAGIVSGATCHEQRWNRARACDPDERSCPVAQLCETNAAVRLERCRKGTDGRDEFIAVHAHPVCGKDGRLSQAIVYEIDVTERQRLLDDLRRSHDELERRVQERTASLETANAALRESEARLNEAQAIAHLGYWDWNLQTGRVVWSDEVFRMSGFEPGEVEPAYELYMEIIHPDDRERMQTAAQRALEDKTGFEIEYRAVRPNGAVAHFVSRGRVATDDAGEAVRMIGTMLEITERKQAELALAEERRNLARTIALRTRELRESLRELEELNRQKGRFLSTVSHELRTPLNSILGFAELLAGEHFGALTAKQREYVGLVNESGKHLLALINDFLDIAKIDSGRLELEVCPFTVEDLLEKAVADHRAAFDAKGVSFDVFAPDVPVPIQGDLGRCRRVLSNLLSNAAKFTPAGGCVELRVLQTDWGGVKIAVTDTGIGIPVEKQARIFSEFYQSKAAYDAQLGGAGIGLALTRRLVELHGGAIGVVSEEGLGSTFWFTLPQAVDGLAALYPVDPAPVATVAPVIVAEAGVVNQALLVELLTRRGHQALVAHTDAEIAALAEAHAARAVFLDWALPQSEPGAIVATLHALKGADGPAVVAVVAPACQAVPDWRGAGCAACLLKPIQSAALDALLGALLEGDSAG